jgi:hypothetical protein
VKCTELRKWWRRKRKVLLLRGFTVAGGVALALDALLVSSSCFHIMSLNLLYLLPFPARACLFGQFGKKKIRRLYPELLRYSLLLLRGLD